MHSSAFIKTKWGLHRITRWRFLFAYYGSIAEMVKAAD